MRDSITRPMTATKPDRALRQLMRSRGWRYDAPRGWWVKRSERSEKR